jgi:hypothetical protein
LICFPSKLDPDNSHESLNPQFSIENIEGNELATSCNGEEMKKHWNGILGVQKVFHAIQLRTIDEGKIELTTSFHEKKLLIKFRNKGNTKLNFFDMKYKKNQNRSEMKHNNSELCFPELNKKIRIMFSGTKH